MQGREGVDPALAACSRCRRMWRALMMDDISHQLRRRQHPESGPSVDVQAPASQQPAIQVRTAT